MVGSLTRMNVPMLRHFECPVGSFMNFYLCVGLVALVNSVSYLSVDDCWGLVR